MAFKISLSFHIIGIVMWLGSLLLITRILVLIAKSESPVTGIHTPLKRAWLGFGLGGLGVSLLSGIFQLMLGGIGFYMKQGWFHGKLTLVILLFVVTFLVTKEIFQYAEGGNLSLKRIQLLHGASGGLLLFIVLITMLGRIGII